MNDDAGTTAAENPALAAAIIRQWTWKTAAMQRMTVAVCRLALAQAGAEFSANDLPAMAAGGSGISGAVFNRLARDGVIAPVGHFEKSPVESEIRMQFVQRFVKNGGGNRIGVWRLKNGSLARLALELHDRPDRPLRQADLMLA